MMRIPCRDNRLKKGIWTPEEDKKLIADVTRYCCWNWRLLPKFAGLERCGKSCRLRWLNYLNPNIKRRNYTEEEDETIIRLHEKHGNGWSKIAAHLPGRTENEIKNRWHTALKKRFQPNAVTNAKPKGPKPSKSQIESRKEENSVPNGNGTFQSNTATSQITNYSPLSPQSSSSQLLNCITTDTAAACVENLFLEDGFAFLDAYTEPISTDFWTEPFVSDN